VTGVLSPWGGCERLRGHLWGLEGLLGLPIGEVSEASLRLAAFPRPLEVACWSPAGADRPRYPGEVAGRWGQTVELRFTTAPAVAPFLRAGLGGGWMRGVPAPFGTVSVGLRTGGRTPIALDAGIRLASTLRVHVTPLVEDGLVVDVIETGRDREWAAGADIRLAMEAPFSPRRRGR
jgi:hypothetical protein